MNRKTDVKKDTTQRTKLAEQQKFPNAHTQLFAAEQKMVQNTAS